MATSPRFLAEPYQGAGGVIIPPAWFLPRLAALADSLGALLIVDEVQSGFGRTGSLFAVDQTTVVPDIVVFGKAMGNGMPIGALATTDSVSQKARYGASPARSVGTWSRVRRRTPCSTRLSMTECSTKARALSDAISPRLSDLVAVPVVERVRMWGLAIGIELTGAAASASLASLVVRHAREAGLVLFRRLVSLGTSCGSRRHSPWNRIGRSKVSPYSVRYWKTFPPRGWLVSDL